MHAIDHILIGALPTHAARLVVQRWAELTADGTHPEFRLRPIGAHWAASIANAEQRQVDLHPKLKRILSELAQDSDSIDLRSFFDDVQQDRGVRAIERLPSVSRWMVLSDRPRHWQYVTALSFLLNELPAEYEFQERLERFVGTQQANVDEIPSTNVVVHLNPRRSHTAKLGRLPALNSYSRQGFSSKLRSGTGARANHYQVEGAPIDATFRDFVAAASELRHAASIWLSVLRLTVSDTPWSSEAIYRSGADYLRPLVATPAPAIWSRRDAPVVAPQLLDAINRDDGSGKLQGGLKWASIAAMHWKEDAGFATALMWMALEALFGDCVIDCRKNCPNHRKHQTALDAYMSSRRDVLADDLLSYIGAVSGDAKDRRRGRRRRPRWWSKLPPCTPDIQQWIVDLTTALEPHRYEDPLFYFRAKQLSIESSENVGRIRRRIHQDLQLLQALRHIVAHRGRTILDEAAYSYLWAVAIYVFRAGLSHVLAGGT